LGHGHNANLIAPPAVRLSVLRYRMIVTNSSSSSSSSTVMRWCWWTWSALATRRD